MTENSDPNLTPPALTFKELVSHVHRTVAAAKERTPMSEVEAMVAQEEPPRNFFQAVTKPVRDSSVSMAVIAEIKRRSPFSGWLRQEYADDRFDLESIARNCVAGGACALACPCEGAYWGGELAYIRRIKDAVSVPVLRSDLIVDPFQLWESRAHGADAVVLTAEALTESEIIDMLILAQQLQLTTLLTVHDMDGLLRVRPHVGFPHPSYMLLGISNRDLHTHRSDLSMTLRMSELVEDKSVLVSISGVESACDVRRLRQSGVRMVMIGESLMKRVDQARALREVLGNDIDDPNGRVEIKS